MVEESINNVNDNTTINDVVNESMEFTAKGKLYARLINNGKRVYPDEIPSDLIQETYDAYTYFYKYTPELVPPNSD